MIGNNPVVSLESASSGKITIVENPVGDILEYKKSQDTPGLTFIIIFSGTLECTVNRSHYFLSTLNLAILPEALYLGKMETSDDFKGYMITLDRNFLDKLHHNMSNFILWRKSNEMMVQSLSKNEAKTFKLYINVLMESVEDSDNAFHDEISWLLAKAFSCKIFGQYANSLENTEQSEPSGRKDAIAKKYIKMVQENATQHRDLDFYADQLCITPKYLSHVVSKTTGKKALKWIEDYILVQAMDLLKSSEMTINQVSEQLNFLTQSDFCRFFRKNAGMTPSQYRKKKDVVLTS